MEKEAREATKNQQEHTWATFAHLSGFLGFVVPFGNIVAPLVIWLTKKNEMPFVNTHAKEALNFQISITIYSIIAFVLMLLLIGFPLLLGIVIFEIIMIIKASIAANHGQAFRYPITLRFIS